VVPRSLPKAQSGEVPTVSEVQYLRHTVSPKGITTDPEKLKAVWEWPTPNNKHEIRSFVGLYTSYRRFISGFANVAKLLTKLMKKQAFQWTPEVEALCTALILAYLQSRERLTDPSNVRIGGVLSQVQDRQELVKAYYSKTLNETEITASPYGKYL
jgi:hypothetical protein